MQGETPKIERLNAW